MEDEPIYKAENKEAYSGLIPARQPNDSKVASDLSLGVAVKELYMNYQFNIELATQYGVDEAVMLHNIIFWLRKNKANKKNFHDGFTWTFNTAKAYTELFPFWNARKIARVLKSLEEKGAVQAGNYNKVKYDRTKWYALFDESLLNLPFDKNGNGSAGNDQPIPDGKPNGKQDSKPTSYKAKDKPPAEEGKESSNQSPNATEQEKIPAARFVEAFNATGLPKIIKLTPERKKHLNARIKEWSEDEVLRVIKLAGQSTFLSGKNDRGWKATFDWLMGPNNFAKVVEGRYDEVNQQRVIKQPALF